MNGWMAGGIALAAAVGVLLPLQALINARLGQATEGALFASFASFFVGTLVLAVALLATRTPLPGLRTLAGLPAWIWAGGLIGALFVLCATVLVPKLGAVRPMDAWRVLGAVLVAIGAVLVLRPMQAG